MTEDYHSGLINPQLIDLPIVAEEKCSKIFCGGSAMLLELRFSRYSRRL